MTIIYIGPYLVIPPTRVVSNKLERVCSNHCDKPAIARPAKFCANCGGAVAEQNVPIEEVKPLCISKLEGRWLDALARPEYGQRHPKGDVWLPNQGRHGIRLDRGSEDSFTPLLLADIDGEAMLKKAQSQYAEIVAALKADFGVEAFWEVGVMAYAY